MAGSMLITITNMRKYQHFHNGRNNTWVKLYTKILDRDYAKLPHESWRLGLELLMMMVESNAEELDITMDALSWRLRRKITQKTLLTLTGINYISVVYQDDNDNRVENKNKSKSKSKRESKNYMVNSEQLTVDESFESLWKIRKSDPGETLIGDKAKALEQWNLLSLDERNACGKHLDALVGDRIDAARNNEKLAPFDHSYRRLTEISALFRWIRDKRWK